MKKTISFALLHFSIAFTVAYLLTGDLIIGSLIAMIEPAVNTIAFYFHELIWQRSNKLKQLAKNPKIKTISFACVHFSVAFSVVYLLTGDMLAGGIIALLEPSINTIAYYFHEKVWSRLQKHTHFSHA